jgi:deoxycytidine triphosphate deaminase
MILSLRLRFGSSCVSDLFTNVRLGIDDPGHEGNIMLSVFNVHHKMTMDDDRKRRQLISAPLELHPSQSLCVVNSMCPQ